jgi:hypothetical protein
MQIDFNVHAIYQDDYSTWFVLSYLGGEAGIMAMAKVADDFAVVYSYDSRLAPVNQYVNGSHEFGIQYTIPYVSNKRVITPRYF